jgi:hypothetical protein
MADRRKQSAQLINVTDLVSDAISRRWLETQGERKLTEREVTRLLDAELALLRLRLAARANGTGALPALYPYQRQILSESRRYNVLCIGRRAGKTFLGAWLALSAALAGKPVGWFAPSYKFVLEAWRELLAWAGPVARRVSSQERRIEFAGGGVIEFWSLENRRAGQSRKYALAVIDEAASVAGLRTLWNQAIRPTLLDLAGRAWFLSTPQGINYFFELFQQGRDEEFPQWQCWQAPSSVNPLLKPDELAAMMAEMPEDDVRQEILAEFIRGEGAVFRNIVACLGATPALPAEHADHHVVLGVDWGKDRDFTVISAYCRTCAREVEIDRFRQIGWQVQRDRLAAKIEKWRPRIALVESNSIGEVNLEELASAGWPVRGFLTTAQSKGPLIRRLALAFEKTLAQWLPEPVARLELEAFMAVKSPLTGFTQYRAPEGGHDDTVIGRALAYIAAEMPEIVSHEQLRAAQMAPGAQLLQPLFES